jgi:hypothetical protein
MYGTLVIVLAAVKLTLGLPVNMSKLKALIPIPRGPVLASRISKLPEEPGAAVKLGADTMRSARTVPVPKVAASSIV